MTVSDLLAQQTSAAAHGLYHSCAKMSEERLLWTPACEGNTGRAAFHQLGECAVLNLWGAECLQAQANLPLDLALLAQERIAYGTKSAALARLQQSANALISAIASFPETHWAEITVYPFTESPCPWTDFAHFFIWNMTYHMGQINYIQTLYGDARFSDGETYRLLYSGTRD